MVNWPAYLRKGMVVIATLVIVPPSYNWLAYHNTYEDKDHTLILNKMDGWMAHSVIQVSYLRKDITIEKFDPLGAGSRRYKDNNRNGLLDEVRIELPLFSYNGTNGTFNHKNLTTHGEVLETAEREYQQELREFMALFCPKLPKQCQVLGLEKKLGL